MSIRCPGPDYDRVEWRDIGQPPQRCDVVCKTSGMVWASVSFGTAGQNRTVAKKLANWLNHCDNTSNASNRNQILQRLQHNYERNEERKARSRADQASARRQGPY